MRKIKIDDLLIKFILADEQAKKAERIYHDSIKSNKNYLEIRANYLQVLNATMNVEESFENLLSLKRIYRSSTSPSTGVVKDISAPVFKIQTIIEESKNRSYCYVPASLNIGRIKNCDLWCDYCESTSCLYKHSISV